MYNTYEQINFLVAVQIKSRTHAHTIEYACTDIVKTIKDSLQNNTT